MTWLLAFAAMFATDLAWAVYVARVRDDDAVRSSLWAVALFLVGAYSVILYVSDVALLVPSALGAFLGTFAGVKWNRSRTGSSNVSP